MRKKGIIITAVIIIILLIGTSAYAYQAVRSPLLKEYDEAIHYAKSEGMAVIHQVDYYHGTEAYYVIDGEQDGKEVWMWIADDYQSSIVKEKKAGISAEKAGEIAKRDEGDIKIEDIRLGFERNLPVYEVTYISEQGRKGYYYVAFSDGTFIKKYQLRIN